MGRWNQNGAWREFGRWAAAACMGVYIVLSFYAFFILAKPFAETVLQGGASGWLFTVVVWIFRIGILLNLIAVFWLVLKVIDRQEGEWPN